MKFAISAPLKAIVPVASLVVAGISTPAIAQPIDLNAPLMLAAEPLPAKEAEQSPTIDPIVADLVEVVKERYPTGEVKIERQVTLDDEKNYVKDGPWKMFDKQGNVVASGQYKMGKRTGVWTKWHSNAKLRTTSAYPFNRFKAPYLATASFTDGVLDGHMMIVDSEEKKIMQISIENGKRHGVTITWLPNGAVLRQTSYEKGMPVGEVLELKANGREAERVATYIGGRKVINKKTNFPRNKQRQTEELYLDAKTVQKTADSFWDLTFAEFEQQGEQMRHGPAKEWYANGQLKIEGQYRYGKMIGRFTYWHANGQKQAEGEYREGEYDGRWVWWHENGQKSAIGDYRLGAQAGRWYWWMDDGRLQKQKSYTEQGVRSAAQPNEVK